MQFLLPLTTLLLTLSTGVAARPSVVNNLVAKDVNKSCDGVCFSFFLSSYRYIYIYIYI